MKRTIFLMVIGLVVMSCLIQAQDNRTIVDPVESIRTDNQSYPNKVYQVVEQMPQFPGGDDSLHNFISKNLRYPKTYLDYQGRVICRIIVNKDGSVSNIEVIRSLETSFDAEAIKVLKLLPKFIPGNQNGRNVRVWYTLPIAFKPE